MKAEVLSSDTNGTANSTTGVAGYDLVAYFTDGKPVRGKGHHTAVFDGVTYLFATEDHQKEFEANPDKFLPAYGGYCAFGVSVGKKFVSDPEVWKIVDGRLYLNLDTEIQEQWEQDVPGNISKGDARWPDIKDRAPSEL